MQRVFVAQMRLPRPLMENPSTVENDYKSTISQASLLTNNNNSTNNGYRAPCKSLTNGFMSKANLISKARRKAERAETRVAKTVGIVVRPQEQVFLVHIRLQKEIFWEVSHKCTLTTYSTVFSSII